MTTRLSVLKTQQKSFETRKSKGICTSCSYKAVRGTRCEYHAGYNAGTTATRKYWRNRIERLLISREKDSEGGREK